MRNPFEYGRELGTKELVDRADEVRVVCDTVEQGSKLFLIGPRHRLFRLLRLLASEAAAPTIPVPV